MFYTFLKILGMPLGTGLYIPVLRHVCRKELWQNDKANDALRASLHPFKNMFTSMGKREMVLTATLFYNILIYFGSMFNAIEPNV